MTDNREIAATSLFTVPAGHGASMLAWAWVWRWWWCWALALAAIAIAGAYDWRWWLAGAALVLIACPAVIASAYYRYALSPEQAMQLLPHRCLISSEGIDVVFAAPDDDEAEGKPKQPQHKPWHFEAADIANVTEEGKWMEISLKNGQQCISIDTSAFENHADLALAREFLIKN